MHEINFSDYYNDTTLCGIIEPLKEGDKVYILTKDGKLYKWDDTVIEVTNEHLAHFKEVSDIDRAEVAVESVVESDKVSFIDIVEAKVTELKVSYESSNKNPIKTEKYLLDYFIKHIDIFPNNYEKLTIKDNLLSIAEWTIRVDKSSVMDLIPDEYKNLQDNDALANVLMGVFVVTLNEDSVNKLMSIVNAVKICCDKLKATKESIKQSDNKEDKKSDES